MYRNTRIRRYQLPLTKDSLEVTVIRSMILAIAIAGTAACVAQDDQTAAVEQHTGVLDCQNKTSISGVQCLFGPVNVDVKNVSVLDGNKLNILSEDLNDIDIGDINILNYSSILSDLVDVSKNDFLNKFNINVAPHNTCAGVVILGVQHVLCK
jgi:hypothetical protein